MSSESLHPSVYRENAVSALVEIRACYGDMQKFVAGAFDRLGEVVAELGSSELPKGQTKKRAEREAMQDQIAQLAQLANDLAQSVAEHKRGSSAQQPARPNEAKA
jgi:hypothetical protein